MTLSGTGTDPHLLATAVRREFLRLAAREDDLAATEAASVPYWAPSGTAAPSPRTTSTSCFSRSGAQVDRSAQFPCSDGYIVIYTTLED